MNSYKSLIRADYLQRTRSYGFLITLLVSVYMAYIFVPPAGANYSTVRIGDFIGENNAAWIGHVTAIMASTFLWLFGFYLVNNGIRRDSETGVGQIVATTSISNFKYLLAKSLSNFFVLLTITMIVMLMAVGLVVFRGGHYPFNIIQFFFPYIFSTIPSIFFVSVIAVFAEVILSKYPNLQNISFFFLFIIIIGISHAGSGSIFYWTDVLGTKQLTDGMEHLVNTNYSKAIEQVSVGFIFNTQTHLRYFLFPGTHWSVIFIFSRLIWIGMAFVLLFISARVFHRFDIKERVIIKKRKNKVEVFETNFPLKDIHLSTLPVATPAYGILPFVKIELLMLLREGPKWVWLINAGGFIALVFMPLALSYQFGLPVLWFLQINRWAGIATKENINRTHYFTYSSYKPLQRLLTSQIIAGILLATVLAMPVIFRFAINGDYLSVINIILVAMFIVAFSVFSGIISGGKRVFEIVFFILTYAYVSVASGSGYFDGVNHGITYAALLFAIIGTMLLVAYMFRRYEIRNQ